MFQLTLARSHTGQRHLHVHACTCTGGENDSTSAWFHVQMRTRGGRRLTRQGEEQRRDWGKRNTFPLQVFRELFFYFYSRLQLAISWKSRTDYKSRTIVNYNIFFFFLLKHAKSVSIHEWHLGDFANRNVASLKSEDRLKGDRITSNVLGAP